jgi:hypothetical protein
VGAAERVLVVVLTFQTFFVRALIVVAVLVAGPIVLKCVSGRMGQ